jgi:leucyl aminopeptidase (aminopeptidase T)
VALEDALARAAAVTVERLGATAGEQFLVVYNEHLVEIATAITAAANCTGCHARALMFPPTARNGDEPPDNVAAALSSVDAAAMVTKFSLSHTRARIAATEKGVRIAGMAGGIDSDIFCRLLPTDYASLESRGRALAEQLTAADRCRITSPEGTEVELVIRGRTGRSDDGDLRRPGAFGNLPAGEAYIAPNEELGEGLVVFDGSLTAWGLLDEPLRVELAGGRIVGASGGAAARFLLDTLDSAGPAGRVIAELGVGTNPMARIGGRIIEDEKAAGTIHIAFGTNISLGGANYAAVHLDGVVRNPTVELDGTRLGETSMPPVA